MKRIFVMILALVFAISLCACSSSKETAEPATAEATTQSAAPAEAGVTQADIEENIIGKWIKSEVDGQPVPTDEKSIFDIASTTEAYASASRLTDEETPFDYNQKCVVDINDNIVIITTTNSEGELLENEFTITNISDNEFTANRKFTRTLKGTDPFIKEEVLTFVKVNEDFSKDILGTWEGRCISQGSVFDDGQDHRWEYKDDGTYVYYVKDGDDWVPSEDTMNEYFVAGNLLCMRWMENDTENREWWDITIDGDTMNWTALREADDGSTFTATFEMSRVKN